MRTRSTLALSLGAAMVALTLVAPASVADVDETTKATATTIAAGSAHSVVLDAAGRVWGVGSNADGQLGLGAAAASLRPVTGLPAGVSAKAVDAGPSFTLVLGSNGVVYGTGANGAGQLTGTGGADVMGLRPLTGLPGGVRAVTVAAGTDFSLVIGSDGRVYGTGGNGRSQLTGTGQRSTLTPLAGLPSGKRALSADAGHDFTVVVDVDGIVYGAGSNASHQLSLPSTADVRGLTAFAGMPDGYRATAVAAGSASSSVLLADDRIVSAGRNTSGELGVGSTTSHAGPVIAHGTGFVAVAASPGGSSVLAVKRDGFAYGAGSNAGSQLTGTAPMHTTFERLADLDRLDKAVEVAAGPGHTLVRDAPGIVFTTGSAAPGAVGTTLSVLPDQRFAARDRPSFITGSRVLAGDELTANEATWIPVGAGTSSFQWRRDGVDIEGADEQVYAVVPADYDTTLTVVETRSGDGFTAGFRESEGTAVDRPALRQVRAPKISGRPVVGAVLSSSEASFDPQHDDLTRQWLRNGRAIRGATGSSYRLTTADAGTVITISNRGTRPDGAVGELSGQAVSGQVKIGLLNTARPTIRGTAKVGRTLRLASRGVWYGPQSYTYRWYRGGTSIAGATRTSYKIKKADRGKKITVRVSARRTGFPTVVAISSPTKKVKK